MIDDDRKQKIQSILAEAAEFVGVLPPAVRIRQLHGGFAYYDAICHKVVLSTIIAESLSEKGLRALIGHEVGHVTQRKERLQQVAVNALPSLMIFALGAIVTLKLALDNYYLAAITTVLLCLSLVAGAERWIRPHWATIARDHEAEADNYACSFCGGDMRAMDDALAECVGILREHSYE